MFWEITHKLFMSEKKRRVEKKGRGRPGLEVGGREQNKASGLFAQLQDTQSSLKINVAARSLEKGRTERIPRRWDICLFNMSLLLSLTRHGRSAAALVNG